MAAELREVEETAIAQVKQESISILDRAKQLIVKDQQSYNLATELYKAALSVEKAADAAHDPVIGHWHGLHKAACDAKKQDKDLATQAKVLAKKKASDWQDEQERIRQAEERRLAEKARKQAEEAARIAREAAEAEAKRIREQEEAERLRIAQEAEAAGATVEQVTEILDAPLYVPEVAVIEEPVYVAPVVKQTYQKAQGFSVRWNYSAQCTDVIALIRAAATNPTAFAMYLQPNEKVLNQIAKNQKEAFSIPGCQLKKERV